MAYYNYYRGSQPNWGTQQYQVVPPPLPQYQPQPFWSGADYYRAHSGIRNNTVFDYVMHKIRDLVGAGGVTRKEARHWWGKIYTGLVDPTIMLPKDIGAAAAYEALRCWETHGSIYVQPLSADLKSGKEALIGIAIAEAMRLWAITGRQRDRYGRMEASEVAAATASRLFSESYGRGAFGGGYGRRSISRRKSRFGGRYEYLQDAPYDEGDATGYPGLEIRGRRRSLTPYGARSVSPTPFGDAFRRSPPPYSGGLRHLPSLYAYGPPVRTMGSVIPSTSYVDGGVVLNSSHVTYDPILGPGISGTYYPYSPVPRWP
ncbi:hypothetical protein BU17DRAFT_65016 [Hysterangium stoloniferum]|nr:hypothetical protein BU17DRAFT_65016 [Hysterangium stoloniferum]